MKYTYWLEDLPKLAGKILSETTYKNLLFYGEMGTGKTTLIKELARKLGVEEELSSPTFSIVNEHKSDDGPLYHFDFYRLENISEALDIGVEEYLESGNWNMIEWPQKIEGLIEPPYVKLEISTNDNGSRTIKMLPVN